MPILDTLTDAIANPRQVRASQQRASQRMYLGLDRKMKSIRDVSPEFVSDPASEPASFDSSRAHSRERPDRPVRPVVELHRSQSETPIHTKVRDFMPNLTPCITATDLTSDQVKRNYSSDDLAKWDRGRTPIPPLNTLKGLGRYRTSITADPRWRADHVRKQAFGIDGLHAMVAEIDMSQFAGISSEEWQELARIGSRRDSVISSDSTQTNSSTGLPDYVADPVTAARIARGFSLSVSSSARSSFNAHSRKGSNLPTMTLPSEPENHLQTLLHQHSSSIEIERRGSGSLSTIKEAQSDLTTAEAAKKLQKPCEFLDKGDPDSAVASDEEGDAWTDVAEARPNRPSAISQLLQETKEAKPRSELARIRTRSNEKRHSRGSTTDLERSKTVRPTAPQRRRTQSKAKLLPHYRTRSSQKHDKDEQTVLNNTSESGGEGTELTMQIRRPAGSETDGGNKTKNKGSDPSGSATTDEDTLVADNELEYLPRAP